MPKNSRVRIDYMPGNAALEALGIAESMLPKLRTQALIDRLVITGVCALQWKAPTLWGDDRDRWQLPDTIKPGKPA
ncbi:MAG: hypothetical protein BWY80_01307 [Firmicutes bacterium ADurb.Bin456]|jgi:hypothetical protein|nr:MAG: hypothetical protein BWY80_01307 [Firmicutes bacterium ADurb.Bin456]